MSAEETRLDSIKPKPGCAELVDDPLACIRVTTQVQAEDNLFTPIQKIFNDLRMMVINIGPH
jgi:hypothetical protein